MTASPMVQQSTVSHVSSADRADFNGFYAANAAPITAQIRAYVGDLPEAEDLVAEAFCRALARWGTISAYDNPATWVRRSPGTWRPRGCAAPPSCAASCAGSGPPRPTAPGPSGWTWSRRSRS